MDFIASLHSEQEKITKEIGATDSAQALETLEKKYFGRNGSFTALLKSLQKLSAEERKTAGQEANAIKQELSRLLREKRSSMSGSADNGEAQFALQLPGITPKTGSVHPLMSMQDRMVDICRTMGYEVVYGPEIELAKYNFDLLNIPENHPARDLWDTFYVATDKNTTGPNTPLLRTHVSSLQLRIMENRTPPIRYVAPGRIFRHEATDATHEANFYQFDGVAIDKGLTFADLLGTLESFFKALFGQDTKIRFQPSFFPFVEPGAELLMYGRHGWMEMLGCGMIHPKILKNMGIDPKVYSGFAWGMGLDRIMMYYYDVPDVRLSYQGDLRFLEQFPL